MGIAMSRKLHILERTSLLLLLGSLALFGQDRFLVHTKGDIHQIAKRYGLKVVRSLPGSGSGLHILESSGHPARHVLVTLAADAGVQSAEPDQPLLLPGMRAGANVHPDSAPSGRALPLDGTVSWYYTSRAASGYVNQPAAGIIRLQQAHGISAGEARVAVIDTGIDRTNLVLANSIEDGWDFVHNQPAGQEKADINQETTPILDQETTPILDQETTPILDGGTAMILNQETTPILDQETTPILDDNKYPAYGHGTMVSGLIHLVAPKARLLAARAFAADGTATLSQIVSAIYWAVDQEVDVINMSFSSRVNSPALQRALNVANYAGIICVSSAGNDGQDIQVWPAAYGNVIGVGSTDDTLVRSLFSNFGGEVSLAAPGEALITTYPSTDSGLKQHYAEVWGTSFSAPLVAGAAALLVDVSEGINGTRAAGLLLGSANPIGNQGLGAGELDVFQAVTSASRNRGGDDQ
jgi:subtilisin family serine protease